jgi:hypothetical protein
MFGIVGIAIDANSDLRAVLKIFSSPANAFDHIDPVLIADLAVVVRRSPVQQMRYLIV